MTNNLGMKAYLIICAVYALILLNIGCQTAPISQENAPPLIDQPETQTRVALSWETKPERKVWSDHLMKELRAASDLLEAKPADVAAWCPKYASLTKEQRAVFYGHMIAEAAKWESSLDPSKNTYECRSTCVYKGGCRYVEGRGYCMKGGHSLDGGLVISRGLMQMSLESAQSIGCPLKEPKELNDPLKNLSCAVRGFNLYIPGGGYIATKGSDEKWKGAAAYWAVWRGTNEYTKQSRAAIQAASLKAPGCK